MPLVLYFLNKIFDALKLIITNVLKFRFSAATHKVKKLSEKHFFHFIPIKNMLRENNQSKVYLILWGLLFSLWYQRELWSVAIFEDWAILGPK